MNRNKKVGYTYYGKGGARHTGITNNPKRRRTEHNKATGGDGFLKVQTGPMSKANAKRWESGQRTPTQPDTSRNRPAGAPLRPPVIDGIEELD